MTASNTIETPRREAGRPEMAAPAASAPPRRKPLPLILLGLIVSGVEAARTRAYALLDLSSTSRPA